MTSIRIRAERAGQDLAAIRLVNERAFGGDSGGSYESVRTREDVISLVAEQGDQIVGSILFTPAVLEDANGDLSGMGLLLLAVDPEFQRQGVGRQLTEAGLGMLRDRRCPFVIVIGKAGYYPRFGFRPGNMHAIRCQWDGVSDESFMVHVLDPDVMAGKSGVARYCDEF